MLQPLSIRIDANDIDIGVGTESLKIVREGEIVSETDGGYSDLPDEVDEETLGS